MVAQRLDLGSIKSVGPCNIVHTKWTWIAFLLAMENKFLTILIQEFDATMISKEFHVVMSFVGFY